MKLLRKKFPIKYHYFFHCEAASFLPLNISLALFFQIFIYFKVPSSIKTTIIISNYLVGLMTKIFKLWFQGLNNATNINQTIIITTKNKLES